jgi:hypothetical protein
VVERPLDAHDRRTSSPRKKSLSAAIDAVAHGRGTDHAHINDLSLARLINRLHGGTVISAMQVGTLDGAWLDTFIKLAVDLPAKQARQKMIDNKFKEFEREYTARTGVKVH